MKIFTCMQGSEKQEISRVKSLDMLTHNGSGYRQELQISRGGCKGENVTSFMFDGYACIELID